jgi:hypothetical protein
MQALDFGEGVVTLNATTVLDLPRLRTDEEDDVGQAIDRQYWINKGSPATVALADEMLGIANEVTGRGLSLKYNKSYIGMAKDGIPENYVVFRTSRRRVLAEFQVKRTREISALVEGAGIPDYYYYAHNGQLVIPLDNQAAVTKHRALITDLIRRAWYPHTDRRLMERAARRDLEAGRGSTALAAEGGSTHPFG